MKIVLYFPGMQPKELWTDVLSIPLISIPNQWGEVVAFNEYAIPSDTIDEQCLLEDLSDIQNLKVDVVIMQSSGALITALSNLSIPFILVTPQLKAKEGLKRYKAELIKREVDQEILDWVDSEAYSQYVYAMELLQNATTATVVNLAPQLDVSYVLREEITEGRPIISQLGTPVNKLDPSQGVAP